MIFCMPVPEKEKKEVISVCVRQTGLCIHIPGTRELFLIARGGILWCWRVTTKTRPKLETVREKSLAPRVLPKHYNEKRLEMFCKTDVNVCLFLLF